MISTDNLCMSCMRDIGDAKQCPYCGYHVDSAQIPPYLPVRTVVANRYLIGKLLDYNGEGATYIGWDLSEKKAVNIREFIPDSITIRTSTALNLKIMTGSESTFRDCNQSFLELWNKLMRLQGLSALINVTNVVEDYGTSYAVYDHIEGVTLREFLLSSRTGYVAWDRARQLLMPILSTLGTLHSAGIIHRGISPSTLIIGRDGKVCITGFSIWQARTSRGDLEAQLYPGYAAIEQYGFEGQQGPWTDIYSFGAVLYRTLIGSDPIDATERVANDRLMVPGKFAEQLPAYVINGLINALQILPDDRTRTVEQLRAELSASPVAAASESHYASQRTSPTASFTEEIVSAEYQPRQSAPASKGSSKNTRSLTLKAAAISIGAGLMIFVILMLTVFRDDLNIDLSKKESTTAVQSSNAEYVRVPAFIEKSWLDVQSNPVFTSLYKFDVQYEYSDTIPSGYIVNQSTPPDSEVLSGSKITLYVSKGKEKITLPADIIGADYSAVYDRLVSLGFRVEKSKEVTEGDYKDNEVISASPKEGNAYDKGTKVILMVYHEPETSTESPDPSIDEPSPEPEPTSDPPEEPIEPPEEPDNGEIIEQY